MILVNLWIWNLERNPFFSTTIYFQFGATTFPNKQTKHELWNFQFDEISKRIIWCHSLTKICCKFFLKNVGTTAYISYKIEIEISFLNFLDFPPQFNLSIIFKWRNTIFFLYYMLNRHISDLKIWQIMIPKSFMPLGFLLWSPDKTK